MFYNSVTGIIRTSVAALVGMAVAWLVARNVILPDGAAEGIITSVTIVAMAGYTALVNLLAVKVHPAFGYLLGSPKTPEYRAVAAARSDGQVIATTRSALPTGDLVYVAPVEAHDPAKVDNSEPHPYEGV